MEAQTPNQFEGSPQAMEYIAKLQKDPDLLPAEAGLLERRALDSLKKLGNEVRGATANLGNVEKQIEHLQLQAKRIGKDIDSISGQMSAFAEILVAAEQERRASAKPATKSATKSIVMPAVKPATKPAAKKPSRKRKPAAKR